MKLRYRFLVLAIPVLLTQVRAATPRLEHFNPALFELEPNARYASTDLSRWEIFTRTGVRLGPSLAIEFMGVDDGMKMEGQGPTGQKLSIYQGNDSSKWKSECASFDAVAYRGLYPGIDLVYRRTEGRLKGDFVVQPGVDPAQIRFRFTGAKVRLHGDRLEIRTAKETFNERIPSVYELDGRSSLSTRYRQYPDGSIGFEVTGHDPQRQLVIDPDLTFATFLAGSMLEQVTATVYSPVEAMLLVVGWTESPDLYGATPANFKGAIDGFYGRFAVSSSGAVTLSSMTLFGGSGTDKATSIAINSSGWVVIGGSTTSANFPTAFAYQIKLKGSSDGFIMQFYPFGSNLLSSTYFGGSGTDTINGVAFNASNVVYFAGTTSSKDLPVTNAIQSTYRGGSTDGFVGTLNSNLTLGYSTYLGGAGNDSIAGLAMMNGEVYLTGATDSADFPTRNAYQLSSGGGQDVFVTKLTNVGQLSYSTYLGGNGGFIGYPETGNAITVNSIGEAFVVGVTSSNNFPLVAAAQSYFGSGPTDAFLAKYSSTGSLVFSTYWGGASWDQANAVTILPSGFIAVAGMTSSQDPSTVTPAYAFPTQMRSNQILSAAPAPSGDGQCSNQSGIVNGATFGGYYDAFVAVFWPTGACYWSAYFGGTGSDSATSITSNPSGEILIGGVTGSYNLPLVRPLQTNVTSSGYHGFLAKLTPKQAAVFRPARGEWYIVNNYDFLYSIVINSFVTTSWASVAGTDSLPVVGDWDNTGRPRIGLFRNGTWYLDMNGDNLYTPGVDRVISNFGQAGDKPVVGDWDNTGRVRLGYVRAGVWFLDMDGDNVFSYASDRVFSYGASNAFPVVGDWTNTGKTRIGVVQDNIWYLDLNGDFAWTPAADSQYNLGASTDYPVFGDWDNSGVKRIGTYRTVGYPIGWWYLDINGNNAWDDRPSDKNIIFGGTGDIPVVGIRGN